ncbi:MAG: sigma-54 dependent transcriptional regulator [Steroidobacteraceae bacterium]
MTHEILLVEDSTAQAAVYRSYLEADGHHVHAVDSGEAALDFLQRRKPAAMLLDLQLPGIQGLEVMSRLRDQGRPVPVVVISDHGSADNVVEAMRLGAADFVTKPFGRSRLGVTVANAIRQSELAAMVETYRDRFARERFHGFIGGSLPMQSLYRIIESAAPSKATVFITGESGTGKELCAAAIHAASRRSEGPFVAVNCAALPRELMESEIFGHVKGAYTGAHRQREGAASLADGGTLFLDEIGEMDLDLQSKLLRFVQTGQFQRVGSGETITVDARIVCATNRDPLEMVRLGRFREDLYYRLHVVPMQLPPLRERGDDVLLIARSFLARYSLEEGRQFEGFTPECEQLLMRHRWPGNVRELENVVRNIVVLNDAPQVGPSMLPAALLVGTVGRDTGAPEAASRPVATVADDASTPGSGLPDSSAAPVASEASCASGQKPAVTPLWQVERDAIEAAIARFDGNVPRAAAALEISPSTIYRKRQAWLEAGTALGASA